MAKLGDCLKVSRQGFRLAKLQALQGLQLESVAWEFFIHGHMVRLCQGFSEVLDFSFLVRFSYTDVFSG